MAATRPRIAPDPDAFDRAIDVAVRRLRAIPPLYEMVHEDAYPGNGRGAFGETVRVRGADPTAATALDVLADRLRRELVALASSAEEIVRLAAGAHRRALRASESRPDSIVPGSRGAWSEADVAVAQAQRWAERRRREAGERDLVGQGKDPPPGGAWGGPRT